MPASENATLLANLIDPQVIADYIDEKLINAIRFSPLATIDDTLVATAGSTLTFPAYTYIGAAGDVAEGADIPIARLGTTTKTVTVSKIGKAVEFTDEALLSGYKNNIAEEAAKQILLSINDGVENKLLTAMGGVSTLTHTIAAAENPADGIADALTQFGEDIDGEKVLLIPASFYASLRKTDSWIPNTEIGADAIIRGRVGMIHGCQVVPTNRLNGGSTIYVVKPGALRIVMKRDTLVEFDRDKLAQTNFVIGSKIFAPYAYDERKIIKITLGS